MSGSDDIGSSGRPIALELRETAEDGRRYSPSIGRNKGPVSDVFAAQMPLDGVILEVASGTGEHGAHLVSLHPGLSWTYSDIDEISRASQAAWVAHDDFDGRLKGPLFLDASLPVWREAEALSPFEGVFCANMVHIAPFEVAEGLFAGAGRVLAPGGKLFLYGPFARNGEIAESNARFGEDLKRRDSRWGVRDLDLDLMPVTIAAGLILDTVIEMPANNLSVVFRKS